MSRPAAASLALSSWEQAGRLTQDPANASPLAQGPQKETNHQLGDSEQSPPASPSRTRVLWVSYVSDKG